jgi:hypothetical protein
MRAGLQDKICLQIFSRVFRATHNTNGSDTLRSSKHYQILSQIIPVEQVH